jgi:hypothetical protein
LYHFSFCEIKVQFLKHFHTHAFIHSLIHSLSHSFTRSLTHSHIHSFIHSFTHSFTHSFSWPAVVCPGRFGAGACASAPGGPKWRSAEWARKRGKGGKERRGGEGTRGEDAGPSPSETTRDVEPPSRRGNKRQVTKWRAKTDGFKDKRR